MNFFKLKIVLQLFTVGVLAAFLCWAVLSGLKTGQELAQSEILAKNFESAKKGMGFFYADQNRFPTLPEFVDKKIMLNYFSAFPLPEFESKACSSSWQYKNTPADKASLSVCLPQKVEKLNAGWNTFNFSK